MVTLKIDQALRVRPFHPDDAEALFELIGRNRAHLRSWVHPSTLPDTAQATRVYAIE